MYVKLQPKGSSTPNFRTKLLTHHIVNPPIIPKAIAAPGCRALQPAHSATIPPNPPLMQVSNEKYAISSENYIFHFLKEIFTFDQCRNIFAAKRSISATSSAENCILKCDRHSRRIVSSRNNCELRPTVKCQKNRVQVAPYHHENLFRTVLCQIKSVRF